MNYGNPKTAAGATIVLAGLSIKKQAFLIGLAIIIIIALAFALRKLWRRGKKLKDQ